MKINDKIKVHLFDTNNKEIKTKNFDKIFTVCEENGKLGIYWTEEFTPFETFAHTVIFENVKTGELFHFDNISNSVIKISDICIKSIPCCGCANYETCTKTKK